MLGAVKTNTIHPCVQGTLLLDKGSCNCHKVQCWVVLLCLVDLSLLLNCLPSLKTSMSLFYKEHHACASCLPKGGEEVMSKTEESLFLWNLIGEGLVVTMHVKKTAEWVLSDSERGGACRQLGGEKVWRSADIYCNKGQVWKGVWCLLAGPRDVHSASRSIRSRQRDDYIRIWREFGFYSWCDQKALRKYVGSDFKGFHKVESTLNDLQLSTSWVDYILIIVYSVQISSYLFGAWSMKWYIHVALW